MILRKMINLSLIIGIIYLYLGLRVAALFIRCINKKSFLLIVFILIIVFPIFFVVIGIVDSFIGLQSKIYKKYL